MPRPLFTNDSKSSNRIELNSNDLKNRTQTNEKLMYDKRSIKLIDLVKSLDQKTLAATQGFQDLVEKIQQEYGDVSLFPIGIVSKCFLGHPYEVHILDLSGSSILNHYKLNEGMPHPFENARSVALHNAYAMIEVYNDRLILIRED